MDRPSEHEGEEARSADIDTVLGCSRCGSSYSVRQLVERIESYWPEVDVAISTAPCCADPEELRLESRRVWRGYVYAAGAPHYCAMEAYEAPTLVVRRRSPALVFELDGIELVVGEQRQEPR